MSMSAEMSIPGQLGVAGPMTFRHRCTSRTPGWYASPRRRGQGTGKRSKALASGGHLEDRASSRPQVYRIATDLLIRAGSKLEAEAEAIVISRNLKGEDEHPVEAMLVLTDRPEVLAEGMPEDALAAVLTPKGGH